ncbi:MAG: monovalent cation/H+ antiporter subunit D family protein [Alphaproteobacteria bacterium]|nr:monovalent cation/H+ antiporter subunit D family protein [Alphaproteobacteria bacterium]MDX5370034.1 monovalent cation/H+ antiporter subunit D family protein [Alphaproteobacteria bacterium]MDX5464612.1 monovalent cation/H+ antiporter subunit D family protein [Alphaproteobacteria bacterium]
MSTSSGLAMGLVAQLPALQVVVPLVAAPVCSLMRVRHLPWAFTLAVTAATFLISLGLLLEVLSGGTISYHMGGWQPPFGIEYRIDVFNAFVLLIVSALAVVVLPFAKRSVEREVPASTHALFYTMWLACFAGLLGVVATGDAFNLFVFIEISSLATYVLIAKGSGNDRRALTASFHYLIMGTIGATLYLIGLGFLYMLTGTLNMADLAERLPSVEDNRAVIVAFAFITVGLGLKAAMFPLHTWLPNAYAYAPSAVTAFLASTATKVAVYALIRMLFTIFGFDVGFEIEILTYVFLPLAIAAMFSASIAAILQEDMKRMLAYSSVAQLGYIVLGLSLSLTSESGLTASLLHLFNHALMKGAAFLAVGAIFYRLGTVNLAGIAGLGRRMPWTFGVFIVAGLALIGVPGTAGFVSKWYLVGAAIEAGLWPIAALIVMSSLLAVLYIWRTIEAAFFRPLPEDAEDVREAPLSLLLPGIVLAAACIVFGIHAAPIVEVAQTAAEALLGQAQ